MLMMVGTRAAAEASSARYRCHHRACYRAWPSQASVPAVEKTVMVTTRSTVEAALGDGRGAPDVVAIGSAFAPRRRLQWNGDHDGD